MNLSQAFTPARRLSRSLRGWHAGLRLLRDPTRLDEVFVIDDALPGNDEVMAAVARAARTHESGRRALDERYRLVLDLDALRALPPDTFGRAVARFFDDNGLDPASIPRVEPRDDASYAQAHLYETHDVWHVATGFGTDVAGEVGLQTFYATQLPARLPMILVAGGFLNSAFWEPDDFGARVDAVARGRALGARAAPLFGVRWDALFARPLDAVRAELGLT